MGGRRAIPGYDGSGLAAAAVEWAAVHAVCRAAPLTVVYVVDQVMAGVESRLLDPNVVTALAGETVNEGVERATKISPGVAVDGAVVVGPPAAALLDASLGAEMVVLGARGLGGIGTTVVGPVTAAVMARATCPVVAIVDGRWPSLDRDHPVLVGIDASGPASSTAVRFGAETATAAGTSLTIMGVYVSTGADPSMTDGPLTLGSPGVPAFSTAARQAARDLVDAGLAVAQAQNPTLDVRTRVTEGALVPAVVAGAAGHGLLVLTGPGDDAKALRLSPSVRRAILQQAPRPVAFVPQSFDRSAVARDPL